MTEASRERRQDGRYSSDFYRGFIDCVGRRRWRPWHHSVPGQAATGEPSSRSENRNSVTSRHIQEVTLHTEGFAAPRLFLTPTWSERRFEMEPIVGFLIGLFLIVIGGGIVTVCNTVTATSAWRESMRYGSQTIVECYKVKKNCK